MSVETKRISHVLLADDDPTVRLLAEETLSAHDVQVFTANDGTVALDAFEQNTPDIVLLDVNMPGRNGYEVCSDIRRCRTADNTPILIMTSDNDLEAIRKAYDAGATDFVTKPINWLILSQRIRYMLRAGEMYGKLLKSERRLSTAQRIAGLGYFEFDTTQEVLICSAEACEMLDLESSELPFSELCSKGSCKLKGLTQYYERIHQDDRSEVEQGIGRLFTQGGRSEFVHRVLPRTGIERIIHVSIEALKDGAEHIISLQGALRDITTQRKKELLENDRKKVLDVIARREPLAEVFDQICSLMLRQFPESESGVISFGRPSSKERDGNYDGTPCLAVTEKLAPFQSRCLEFIQNNPDNADILSQTFSSFLQSAGKGVLLPKLKKFSLGEAQNAGAVILMNIADSRGQAYVDDVFETAHSLAVVALERQRLKDKLSHQSRHDKLTGLPNRDALMDNLSRSLGRVGLHKGSTALFLIDLDNFKTINDLYSHAVGDFLLQATAERFLSFKEAEHIARIGGDSFALVVDNVKNLAEISTVTKRIFSLFEEPFLIEGQEIFISIAIGATVGPEDGLHAEDLVTNAEQALKKAKETGRNNCRFHSKEAKDKMRELMSLEQELRRTMNPEHIHVYYQPVVDMQSGHIVGSEALVRWSNSKGKIVSPNVFIPIAESTDLITPLTDIVLSKSLESLRKCRQRVQRNMHVAVNISAAMLKDKAVVPFITNFLHTSGMKASDIHLEVTETSIMHSPEKTAEILTTLADDGFHISLDDFGTGYSSLSYLRKFPFSTLKIDRSFVSELPEDKEGAEIVTAIIKIAETLGLQVVAEGVKKRSNMLFCGSAAAIICRVFSFRRRCPKSSS
jgi:diguanylate cyclase (GGDEF)-like protein